MYSGVLNFHSSLGSGNSVYLLDNVYKAILESLTESNKQVTSLEGKLDQAS